MCGIIGVVGKRECKSKDINNNKISSYSQNFRNIPIKSEIMNILNFIKFENYYCRINPLFQKALRRKISNYSEIARKVNVSRNTVSRILNVKDYWMNFQTLLNISKLFNILKKDIYKNIISIKTHNSFPISFNIKNLNSPSFFRIIGHILGDGGIHIIKNEGKYRAFYVNNEQHLLDSFTNDINSLFKDVKLYSRKRENHGDEIWLPSTVGYLFYKILNYENLLEKRIPDFISNSNNQKLLGAFLQAIYDDEGSIYPTKYMIVISLANKNLLEDIKCVLEKINIKTNKIHKVIPKNRSIMYRFSITSKKNIIKFFKKVNFSHPLKKKKLENLVNKYKGK